MLLRALLATEKNDLRKLELLCQFLDSLEQDVRQVYPHEAPPLRDGFTGTLHRLLVDMR